MFIFSLLQTIDVLWSKRAHRAAGAARELNCSRTETQRVLIGSSDNLQSAAVSERHAFRRSERPVHIEVACRWCADVPGHRARCAQKVDVSVFDRVGIS